MSEWFGTLLSISVAEVLIYWYLLFTVAAIGGVGWGSYISARKRLSSRAFLCPFANGNKRQSIIDNPSQNVDNKG